MEFKIAIKVIKITHLIFSLNIKVCKYYFNGVFSRTSILRNIKTSRDGTEAVSHNLSYLILIFHFDEFSNTEHEI